MPASKLRARTLRGELTVRAIEIDDGVSIFVPDNAEAALASIALISAALDELASEAQMDLARDRARRDAEEDARQAVAV